MTDDTDAYRRAAVGFPWLDHRTLAEMDELEGLVQRIMLRTATSKDLARYRALRRAEPFFGVCPNWPRMWWGGAR